MPKGKVLESDVLIELSMNHTKEQFSNSTDLTEVLMDAIIGAFSVYDNEQAGAELREGALRSEGHSTWASAALGGLA